MLSGVVGLADAGHLQVENLAAGQAGRVHPKFALAAHAPQDAGRGEFHAGGELALLAQLALHFRPHVLGKALAVQLKAVAGETFAAGRYRFQLLHVLRCRQIAQEIRARRGQFGRVGHHRQLIPLDQEGVPPVLDEGHGFGGALDLQVGVGAAGQLHLAGDAPVHSLVAFPDHLGHRPRDQHLLRVGREAIRAGFLGAVARLFQGVPALGQGRRVIDQEGQKQRAKQREGEEFV